MKALIRMICVFSLFIISAAVFAQVLPGDVQADVDWVTLVGQLIANPKAFTASSIGALVVLIIVQAMKSETLGKIFKFIPEQAKFIVITVLGLIYSVIVNAYVIGDQEISKVLVGLLSSGGAAALFMGVKLLFPKFFEVKTEQK